MIKKWCWLAKETSKGWRLSLEIANKSLKSQGFSLTTREVKNYVALVSGEYAAENKIVFVHLKNTKYPMK